MVKWYNVLSLKDVQLIDKIINTFSINVTTENFTMNNIDITSEQEILLKFWVHPCYHI